MPQGSFSAKVSAWVKETKERRVAVYRESAQRIVDIMQTPMAAGGRMRVDTGFLRSSIRAAIGTANFATMAKPVGQLKFTYDAAAISLVIAGADITDPIEVVYTANYARAREYNPNGQTPDRFVAMAAQQWVRVVDEVCREAQARNS
jgi:hypothetical protein